MENETANRDGAGIPKRKLSKREIAAVVGIGLLLTVGGGALGVIARARGWIQSPHMFDDGDPPVVVSDSSLHLRSPKYRWLVDLDGGHTIRSGPNGGELQAGHCTLAAGVSATYSFMGGAPLDISPMGSDWKVTIMYAGNPVYISKDAHGQVNIQDSVGTFGKDDGTGHRKHNTEAQVSHITVFGGKNDVDQAFDAGHPHFTISYCYF
jgi:hypothetical protein